MKKILFNKDWECISHIDVSGEKAKRNVNLPDDYIINSKRSPNSISGAFSGYYNGGTGTYIKKFDLPEEWHDKTVILYVDGAYMRTNVVINTEYIKSNMYGYSPFSANLTPWLKDKNVLRIETSNHQPNSRWYTGGGIYRQAYIFLGGEQYLPPEDIFITSAICDSGKATVNVGFGTANTTLKNEKVTVSVDIYFGEKQIASEKMNMTAYSDEVTHDHILIDIDNPMLWSIDNPNLYTAVIRIEKDGEIADEHTENFGIRKIEIDTENGMRINGEKIKLRGGCIHHDHAMLGAAAYPAAEERKIRILKDLGYNAIRTSHNHVSSTFLDICDRVGMLVLAEAFDNWVRPKRTNDYSVSFRDCWQRDLSAMILRDRNHPCIFAWSIGNEVEEVLGGENGIILTKQMSDCVRSLDSTRPVTIGQYCIINYERAGINVKNYNFEKLQGEFSQRPGELDGIDYWGIQTERAYAQLDIAGYNYAWPRYSLDAKRYPHRIIMATETHPYTMYDYWKAAEENNNCIGDFIWTAFDNLGEAGTGRVTYDPEDTQFSGAYPWLANYQGDVALDGSRRPQSYYHKILWGLDDGIHLFSYNPCNFGKEGVGTGWHWRDVAREWTYDDKFVGSDITVEAYADCDKVEFILNGESVAVVDTERYIAKADIKYQKGRIEAVAYKNGEEIARDSIETTGKPHKIKLIPEKSIVSADGLDLAFIRAAVLDDNGRTVTNVPVEISAELNGAGKLWIGSGNPCTEENYGTGKRFSWRGTVIIAVGASYEKGISELTVTADDIGKESIEITVV